MRRRQVGIVVDRHRVLPEPARRLDHQQHVAEPQRGQHDVAAVHVERARRLAPVRSHRVGQRRGQRVEPAPVVGQPHPGRRRGQLLLGQPLHVVPTGRDQACGSARPNRTGTRRPCSRPRAAHPAARPPTPGCPARPRCPPGSAWSGSWTARRPASARPPGSVRSRACRTASPASRAVRSGSARYTGMSSPGTVSLNENGTVTSRPSNSGIATCMAASIGDSPASAPAQAARELVRHSPCSTGTSSVASAPASQESSAPPAVAVRRVRAAGRQHRGDQRVGPAEQVHQLRIRAAQRRAEHRQRVGPAGLDGRAQVVDEGGVAGQLVGPVEDDADGRTARVVRAVAVHAELGRGHRRGEPLAGQQHRVGQEPVQLAQVVQAAGGQVGQRLGDQPGRHRRGGHQLGVRARPRRPAAPPAARTPAARRPPPARPGARRAAAARPPRPRPAAPAVRPARPGPGWRCGRARPSRGRPAVRCRRWTAAARRASSPRSSSRVRALVLGVSRRQRVSWLPDRHATPDLPASRSGHRWRPSRWAPLPGDSGGTAPDSTGFLHCRPAERQHTTGMPVKHPTAVRQVGDGRSQPGNVFVQDV